MKAVRYVFLILVGVSVLTAQQAGPGGTWKADDLEDWSVYLRTDGSRLTGLVSHCATVFQQPVENGEPSAISRTSGGRSAALRPPSFGWWWPQ